MDGKKRRPFDTQINPGEKLLLIFIELQQFKDLLSDLNITMASGLKISTTGQN